MEEKILIQNLKFYPYVSQELGKQLLDEMVKTDSKELLVLPGFDPRRQFVCAVLEKYYTPALTDSVTVRDIVRESPFRIFTLSRSALSAYLRYLSKQMNPSAEKSTFREFNEEDDPFDMLLAEEKNLNADPVPEATDPVLEFLRTHSPVRIQRELNNYIIGQGDLTQSVADFLYYHALRLRHPELPQRPLLIAGPSGSGKTEVWRTASKLYGQVFQIQIVDGSNLSCDGWAGNYKLSTFITPKLADGGILVVDEFDKLTKPKYTSGGENVAQQMQSEFLKLFEGEHQVTVNKKQTDITSRKMGFVLVGAFEDLRTKKETKNTAIGFCANADIPSESNIFFTDEDFIAYGIMPEIVGRIAVKCATQPLDESAYMNIIRSRHSRVAVIEKVLSQYGICASDIIPHEELKALIAKSRDNRTGVRWVSAQVENRLLEAIREQGLFPGRPEAAA